MRQKQLLLLKAPGHSYKKFRDQTKILLLILALIFVLHLAQTSLGFVGRNIINLYEISVDLQPIVLFPQLMINLVKFFLCMPACSIGLVVAINGIFLIKELIINKAQRHEAQYSEPFVVNKQNALSFETLSPDLASIIGSHLELKDWANVSRASHHCHRLFQPFVNRAKLAIFTKWGNDLPLHDNPPDFFKRGVYGFNRKYSPTYAVAWTGDKKSYQLLANKLYPHTPELNALAFLVITGLENKGIENARIHLQAEEYIHHITNVKPELFHNLIITPSVDGLSTLQLAAAEEDTEMLLALLRPYTNDPTSVAKRQAEINSNDDLTPKEKWKQQMRVVLNNLSDYIRIAAAKQLVAVKNNHWIVDIKPLMKAYADKDWRLIGKHQGHLSRAFLADAFFHPDRSNNPCPHFSEARLPREFRPLNNRPLFFSTYKSAASIFTIYYREYSKLGSEFFICRLDGDRAQYAEFRAGRDVGCDLASVVHLREVRSQQLDAIIFELEPSLSLDCDFMSDLLPV